MAEKVSGRWQETVRDDGGSRFSGMELVATRKGVEVHGWYDSFVGIGGHITLSWDELEAMKGRVMRGE